MANEVSYQVTLNIDKASAKMQGLYDKNAKLFSSIRAGFDVAAARTQIAELVRSFRNGFRKTLITFDTSAGFRQLDVLKTAAQAKFAGIALTLETKRAFSSVNSVSAAAKKGLGDVTMGLNTKNAQQRVDFFVKSSQNKINNLRMPSGANFMPTRGGGSITPPLPPYSGGGGGGNKWGGNYSGNSGSAGSGKSALAPLGKMDSNSFERSIEAASTRVLAFGAITGVIYSVGRVFKTLVADAISVEQSMASLQSILEVSSQSMEGMSDAAFKLANATGTSFTVSIEAMTEFARQGLSANKTIEATEKALTLARISGVSAAEAVRSLTGVANTFANEALDYAKAVDILVALDNQFATSAGGLSSGIQRVGATASEAGVGFKELAATMTAIQQLNARGETVNANGLKTIYTRLQGSAAREFVQGLGIETETIDGFRDANDILEELAQTYDTLSDAQKANTARLLAGTHQVNVFQSLMRSMQGDFSMYRKAIEAAGSATGDAAARLKLLNDTTATLATRLRNNFAKFGAEFGKISVQPFIDKMLSVGNTILKIFDSDIGKKLGEIVSSGLSSVALGPGLIAGLAVVFRITTQIWKEFSLLLKGATTWNTSTKTNASLQGQVNAAITQGNTLLTQRLSLQNQINRATNPGAPNPNQVPGGAGTSGVPTPIGANQRGRRSVPWRQVTPAAVSGNVRGATGPMVVRGQGGLLPSDSSTGNVMHRNLPNNPLVYSVGGYSTRSSLGTRTGTTAAGINIGGGSSFTGASAAAGMRVQAYGGGALPIQGGAISPIVLGNQTPAHLTGNATPAASQKINLMGKAAQKAAESLKSVGSAGAGLAVSFAGGVIGGAIGGKWGKAMDNAAMAGGAALMFGGNPLLAAGAAVAGGVYGYATGKDEDLDRKNIAKQQDALIEEQNAIKESISARTAYTDALREGSLGIMEMNDLYNNLLRSTGRIKNQNVATLLAQRGVENEDKNSRYIQESISSNQFITTINQFRGAISSIAKDSRSNFVDNFGALTEEGKNNVDAIGQTLKGLILENKDKLSEEDVKSMLGKMQETLSSGNYTGTNKDQADRIVMALRAGGVDRESIRSISRSLDDAMKNLGPEGGREIIGSAMNALNLIGQLQTEERANKAKEKSEGNTEEERKSSIQELKRVFGAFSNSLIPKLNFENKTQREQNERGRNALLEVVKPLVGGIQAAEISKKYNETTLRGQADTEKEALRSEAVANLLKAAGTAQMTASNAKGIVELMNNFTPDEKGTQAVAEGIQGMGLTFEKSRELLDEILNKDSELNGKIDRIQSSFDKEVQVQSQIHEILKKPLQIAEGNKVLGIDSIMSGDAGQQQKNALALGAKITGINKEIDKLNKSGGPRTDEGKQQLRNLEVQLAKLEMERRNTMGEILGVPSGQEGLKFQRDNLKNEETIREKQIKDFAIQEITASAERVRETMKSTGSGEVRGFTQENVNKLVKKIDKEGISGANRNQIEESIQQMSKFATNDKVRKELEKLNEIISLFATKTDQISTNIDDKMSLIGDAQFQLGTLNQPDIKNPEVKSEFEKEKDKQEKYAEDTKKNIEKLNQLLDKQAKQMESISVRVDKTLKQELGFEVDINASDLAFGDYLRGEMEKLIEAKIKEAAWEAGEQPIFRPKAATGGN